MAGEREVNDICASLSNAPAFVFIAVNVEHVYKAAPANDAHAIVHCNDGRHIAGNWKRGFDEDHGVGRRRRVWPEAAGARGSEVEHGRLHYLREVTEQAIF
jgi:hypothetical protein